MRTMPKAPTLHNAKPYVPPRWEIADVSAIQAVSKGTASPDQQVRAIEYIQYAIAGFDDLPYRPGAGEGDRDTAFACGKYFVAQQIDKMQKISIPGIMQEEAKRKQK